MIFIFLLFQDDHVKSNRGSMIQRLPTFIAKIEIQVLNLLYYDNFDFFVNVGIYNFIKVDKQQ